MRRLIYCWLAIVAGFVGCSGRGYDATVQGTITIDGELAQRGRVVFHPVDDGPPAYGNIFPNGTYSLRVGQGDLDDVDGGQLASGEYVVTVVVNMPSVETETVGEGGAPMPGARITAAKYADKATSDLRRTVKPGPNVIPLEVESAEVEEVEGVAEPADAATENATGEASTPAAPATPPGEASALAEPAAQEEQP